MAAGRSWRSKTRFATFDRRRLTSPTRRRCETLSLASAEAHGRVHLRPPSRPLRDASLFARDCRSASCELVRLSSASSRHADRRLRKAAICPDGHQRSQGQGPCQWRRRPGHVRVAVVSLSCSPSQLTLQGREGAPRTLSDVSDWRSTGRPSSTTSSAMSTRSSDSRSSRATATARTSSSQSVCDLIAPAEACRACPASARRPRSSRWPTPCSATRTRRACWSLTRPMSGTSPPLWTR